MKTIVDGRRAWLDYCPWCGGTDVKSPLRGKRCAACEARSRRYAICIKKLEETPDNEDVKYELRKIVSEYKRLAQQGYKVPESLREHL